MCIHSICIQHSTHTRSSAPPRPFWNYTHLSNNVLAGLHVLFFLLLSYFLKLLVCNSKGNYDFTYFLEYTITKTFIWYVQQVLAYVCTHNEAKFELAITKCHLFAVQKYNNIKNTIPFLQPKCR